jgi:hypothetical protein
MSKCEDRQSRRYLGLSEATNSFGRQRVRAAPGDTCVPTMPTRQGFHNSVFGRTDQGLQAEKLAVFVFSQRAADSNAIADVVLNNQVDVRSCRSLPRRDEF